LAEIGLVWCSLGIAFKSRTLGHLVTSVDFLFVAGIIAVVLSGRRQNNKSLYWWGRNVCIRTSCVTNDGDVYSSVLGTCRGTSPAVIGRSYVLQQIMFATVLCNTSVPMKNCLTFLYAVIIVIQKFKFRW